MKNIIKSLVVVVAVAAVASIATYAIFTSTASVTGNSVATGTLKISINKAGNKPVSIANMKPGDTGAWGWMDVINVGSLPAYYFFYVDNPVGTPDGNLWDVLKIELRNSGSGATDIDRCNNGNVMYDNLVKNLYGMANKINTTDFAYGSGSQMPAGWSQRICQRVYLTSDVDNSVQGRTLTFDEVMYATQ